MKRDCSKHEQLVRDKTRQQNRRDFHLLADFVDWMRQEFPTSKLVYMEQDGKSIGVKPYD
jgi:hypothetical protein